LMRHPPEVARRSKDIERLQGLLRFECVKGAQHKAMEQRGEIQTHISQFLTINSRRSYKRMTDSFTLSNSSA